MLSGQSLVSEASLLTNLSSISLSPLPVSSVIPTQYPLSPLTPSFFFSLTFLHCSVTLGADTFHVFLPFLQTIFCSLPLSGHFPLTLLLPRQINSFSVLLRLVPPLTTLNKDPPALFLTFRFPLFSLSLTPTDLCFLWAQYTSPFLLSFPSVKILAASNRSFFPAPLHLRQTDLWPVKTA